MDNITHTQILDVEDVAHRVYVQFGKGTTKFAELAEAWANQMELIYNTHPVEFGLAAINNVMGNGFFVGEDANGNIAYAERIITYHSAGPPLFVDAPGPRPSIPIDPAEYPSNANGYFDILAEFKNGGETTRARKVIAELGTIPHGPDGVAKRYAAYVAAIRDWTRDPNIGGDIAVIILERGKGLRWFKRPEFCPEN